MTSKIGDEVAEVRSAMQAEGITRMLRAMGPIVYPISEADIDAAAVRLHAIGWRAGDSADDAARLILEAEADR